MGQKFFVRFLGELKKTKSTFEINGPLGCLFYIKSLVSWDNILSWKMILGVLLKSLSKKPLKVVVSFDGKKIQTLTKIWTKKQGAEKASSKSVSMLSKEIWPLYYEISKSA